MQIKTKRAYEDPEPSDGKRYLVDRIWPRGVSKKTLHLEGWMREIAPSDELRRWFDHDPTRWSEFKRRYFQELQEKENLLEELLQTAQHHKITLVYGAHDTKHNQAVALKQFLQTRWSQTGCSGSSPV